MSYYVCAGDLVREAAYRIYLHPDETQTQLLESLLAARYELARLTGFPTFSTRSLRGTTIQTPELAVEFLEALGDSVREKAANEFQLLAQVTLLFCVHYILMYIVRHDLASFVAGSINTRVCMQWRHNRASSWKAIAALS